MALITFIGGASSIGANWVGGVIPGESDFAIVDDTSADGSFDLLNCFGVIIRNSYTGTITQDADIICGMGGFLCLGGEFVGGAYDIITNGAVVFMDCIARSCDNKLQGKSTSNNLLTVDGLDVYTVDGLLAYDVLAGVELFIYNSLFYRATGDYFLMDSRNVAQTSDWGSFTWGEILYKIRSKINEPNPAFFTDEDLMILFNEAQLYFARETKFLKREQAFTIKESAGSPPYQYVMMPYNFLGIQGCGLQSKTVASDLQWILPIGIAGRSQQSYQDQGFWLMDRGQIRIANEVDVLETNLLVKYYASPAPLTDETDLDVLSQVYDEYMEDVLTKVCSECHLKRKEYEEQAITERRFMARIAEVVRAESKKFGAKQVQVMR